METYDNLINSSEGEIEELVAKLNVNLREENVEYIEQIQKRLSERERLAFLGELAGGIIHDIGSPLQSLQAILYMINKISERSIDSDSSVDDVSKSLKEIFEQSKNGLNSCQKISRIISSVKNHTRNLNGENIETFYISDVIEDTRVILNHQIKQSGCVIEVQDRERIAIKGDPGKFGQVLSNLIINAIQAYSENPGKILINVIRDKEYIIVSVSDNAKGIPEVLKDSILKKIVTSKGILGTGLGLYLSNSIIRGDFGGIIDFYSEKDKGSTFMIKIPVSSYFEGGKTNARGESENY